MKICIKKTYCTDCRKLVRGREEVVTNNTRRVFCARCGKALWLWNGITWKYLGKYSDRGSGGEKTLDEPVAVISTK